MRWTQQALAGVLTLALGCTIPDLDLEGRPCPCVEGWTCQAGTCVPLDEEDAGADAIADAGLRDAPVSETGFVDTPPSDTPTADAGPSDAGPDARPVDPCVAITANPDVLFCESFEGAEILQAPMGGGVLGSVELNTETVHGGSQSAHFAAPARNEGTYLYFEDVFPSNLEGERWVRAWYFVPPANIGAEFLGLTDAAFTRIINQYVGRDPEGSVFSNLHTHGFDPGMDMGASTAFPFGRWMCLEAQIDYTAAESINLFYDSAPVITLSVPLTIPFTGVTLGVAYRDADLGDMELFLDDVVVSTTRIGCE